MIFITVGTHEQQFNRLIKYVDELKNSSIIQEEVIMQTGYCTYKPKYCEFTSILPYNKMISSVNKARIVICHGGPSSIMMPLQLGKIPIVIPRQKVFNEHVNNHQMEFVKKIEEQQKNIIPIYDINELRQTIVNYEKIISKLPSKLVSSNKNFNNKFQLLVNEIMG